MKTFYLLLSLGLAVSFPAPAASWSVVQQLPLGGDGGWDYLAVEPPGKRLFVTHGDHVLVLDLKTGAVVGTLDSAGAHGVAFAPELQRGFISNGRTGMVTIFDLEKLTPIQSVKAGEGPDAICYESQTRRVFAFNGHSRSASVIDAATGRVLGEIPLPGRPEFARADGAGFVFDNIEDKGLVVKIDAAKMTVVAQWPLPPESEPSALAIDVVHHRLFSGCGGGQLQVLDSGSGRLVATLPIGRGVDADFYDPTGQRVFASCGDGTLTVIKQASADQYTVEGHFPTEHGARTMAFDSATQTAYLPDAKFGPVPNTPPMVSTVPLQPGQHAYFHRPPMIPGTFKLLVVRPAP